MQRRSHFLLMCDLQKKKKKFFLIFKKKFKKKRKKKKVANPDLGAGRVGIEVGVRVGVRVGVGVAVGAGRPAPARAQRHPYLSPPPLSNPFSPALLLVALLVALLLSTLCATFFSRSSPLPSLKPCHLFTTSFRCSSRREHAFQFLLYVRTVPIYSALAAGKFFVFFVALCSELQSMSLHSVCALRRWV